VNIAAHSLNPENPKQARVFYNIFEALEESATTEVTLNGVTTPEQAARQAEYFRSLQGSVGSA